MRFNCVLVSGALVLAAVSAAESTQSLPFLVISGKSKLPDASKSAQQDLSVAVIEDKVINSAVASCSYDAYLFVEHPGVTARDINPVTMPYLSGLVKQAADLVAIGSVVDVSAYEGRAEKYILEKCGAVEVVADDEGKYAGFVDSQPRFISIDAGKSGRTASEFDQELKSSISHLVSPNFLLIYRSVPRMVSEGVSADEDGTRPSLPSDEEDTKSKDGSLFDNYQFFSPGIFMTAIVSIMLAAFLIIGLNWLSSLSVTYKSFEKQDTIKRG